MHAFPQVVIFQARGVLSTQVMQSGKKKQEQKKKQELSTTKFNQLHTKNGFSRSCNRNYHTCVIMQWAEKQMNTLDPAFPSGGCKNLNKRVKNITAVRQGLSCSSSSTVVKKKKAAAYLLAGKPSKCAPHTATPAVVSRMHETGNHTWTVPIP